MGGPVRCALTLAALAALVLPSSAAFGQAAEREFRIIRLQDGRTLMAEVLESTAEGMRVELAQGTTLLDYASLAEITPTSEEAWQSQAPLRIAVAPTSSSDASASALAAEVDSWLATAAAVLPSTEVTSPDAWASDASAKGSSPADCGGELDCLVALAAPLGVDLLVRPSVSLDEAGGVALALAVHSADQGGAVGEAQAELGPAGSSAPVLALPAAASSAVMSLYAALNVTPNVDVPSGVAALFEKSEPIEKPETAVSKADPDEASEASEAETGDAVADEAPATAADEVASSAAPPRSTPEVSLKLRRHRSIALGFLPVPGLSSAVLGDAPGFVASAVATVSLSWATVYTVGRFARSPEAFWVPSLLGSYLINVVVNQAAGTIGWKRMSRAGATVSGSAASSPAFVVSIAPVLSADSETARAPRGAMLQAAGSF